MPDPDQLATLHNYRGYNITEYYNGTCLCALNDDGGVIATSLREAYAMVDEHLARTSLREWAKHLRTKRKDELGVTVTFGISRRDIATWKRLAESIERDGGYFDAADRISAGKLKRFIQTIEREAIEQSNVTQRSNRTVDDGVME